MSNLPIPASEPVVVYEQREGRIKYTYYDNGIVKITRYKGTRKIYWGRIFAAMIVFMLLMMGIMQSVKAIAASLKKGDAKNTEATVSVSDTLMQSSSKSGSSKAGSAVTNDDTSSQADKNADNEPLYANLSLKVCIAPAHGGASDRGAVSPDGETAECDQNLELGMLVKECLEKSGVTVIMTRETDEKLSISERCSLANQAGADLYVSLHRNSVSGDETLCGTELWINNNDPKYDRTLAENILEKLVEVGISENRGVKTGYSGLPEQNYQVNIDAVMPSCLLELGFLTNSVDNMQFEEKKNEYAQAIADGIIKTAADLGVIDQSGKRLIPDQLISYEKNGVQTY